VHVIGKFYRSHEWILINVLHYAQVLAQSKSSMYYAIMVTIFKPSQITQNDIIKYNFIRYHRLHGRDIDRTDFNLLTIVYNVLIEAIFHVPKTVYAII